MNGLEMPETLARAGIEGKEAVCEEVRALAIRAVEVVGRRSGRHERDPARLVDRDLAPHVNAADLLPRILRPRVVPVLAGARDGVERPDQRARDDVVGPDVARRRVILLSGRGAEQDQVLEDAAGRLALKLARLVGPRHAFRDVDMPVAAERGDGLAGACVDRAQGVVGGEQDPAVFSVAALPVAEAAAGGEPPRGMRPPRRPRGRVQRFDGIVFSDHVHDAVGNQRVEEDARRAGGDLVCPGELELRDIRLVDLAQGGILHGIPRAAVRAPGRVRRGRRIGRGDRRRDGAQQGGEDGFEHGWAALTSVSASPRRMSASWNPRCRRCLRRRPLRPWPRSGRAL
jgi:hypothetical protein